MSNERGELAFAGGNVDCGQGMGLPASRAPELRDVVHLDCVGLGAVRVGQLWRHVLTTLAAGKIFPVRKALPHLKIFNVGRRQFGVDPEPQRRDE